MTINGPRFPRTPHTHPGPADQRHPGRLSTCSDERCQALAARSGLVRPLPMDEQRPARPVDELRPAGAPDRQEPAQRGPSYDRIDVHIPGAGVMSLECCAGCGNLVGNTPVHDGVCPGR